MRDPALQTLLDAAAQDCAAAPAPDARAHKAAATVFGRAAATIGNPGTTAPTTLPATAWAAPALAASPRATAGALTSLLPRLTWTRRSTATPTDQPFWDGHANTILLGPGGLEERADIWIGATVMEPGLTYVDHDHPPEEVYLPLGPGAWWNTDMAWVDPGNSLIYNPPGIRHAMRAAQGAPFIALWVLPI